MFIKDLCKRIFLPSQHDEDRGHFSTHSQHLLNVPGCKSQTKSWHFPGRWLEEWDLVLVFVDPTAAFLGRGPPGSLVSFMAGLSPVPDQHIHNHVPQSPVVHRNGDPSPPGDPSQGCSITRTPEPVTTTASPVGHAPLCPPGVREHPLGPLRFLHLPPCTGTQIWGTCCWGIPCGGLTVFWNLLPNCHLPAHPRS